jgi:hypothetical protein
MPRRRLGILCGPYGEGAKERNPIQHLANYLGSAIITLQTFSYSFLSSELPHEARDARATCKPQLRLIETA